LIKEGESIRHPNIRKKPVLAMLPHGIKIEDISRQMRKLLEQENAVDVVKAAIGKTWSAEVAKWIDRPLKNL
jgi:hypothetical protein